MSASSPDPRILRTRNLLHRALISLVTEKNFANLTVQDITRKAGVNRTTFYLHYSGLPELLEDCTKSLFSQMRADIYANEPSQGRQDLTHMEPYVESVFLHLKHHAKFYRAMLGKQGDPLFQVLFQELLSELILEPVAVLSRRNEIESRLDMTMRFFSAGFAGIASWWLENDMPISSKEASRQVARNILPDYLRLIESA